MFGGLDKYIFFCCLAAPGPTFLFKRYIILSIITIIILFKRYLRIQVFQLGILYTKLLVEFIDSDIIPTSIKINDF